MEDILGGGGSEEELLWKEEEEEVDDMRLLFVRGDSGGGGKLDIFKAVMLLATIFLQPDKLFETIMSVALLFESTIDGL